MDTSAEAGPSRPSPSRSPPRPAEPIDIVMEQVSSIAPLEEDVRSSEPDEAVQLLLNIASAVDVPPLPPKPEIADVIAEEPPILPKHAPPDINTYPYTPPDESNDQHRDQSQEDREQDEASSNLPPSVVLPLPPHVNSDSVDAPTPPAQPLTPSHTSPEPPATKPKQKRKRNPAAGPSRRASADRPQHWLGEDNTVIRCICGFTEDDGFTIQCEECGAWEHGMCFGYLDEASAPDTYFCELCRPRPVDAVTARQAQAQAMEQQRQAREAAISAGGVPAEKEKPRSKGGKTKRPRTESVMEVETETRDGGGKEHSPGVMGPPATKPKRRQGPGKPRAKHNTIESTPGPSIVPQPIVEEPEDDYFRVEPWALEYTPLKENMIRGKAARQIMRNVYKEWVDAEEEMVASRSKAIDNPSGLPSPTETGVLRLSPEHLFPPPDFHILAPPVPPVFLSGSDLETLGTPTSIRIIEDAPSFLPLTYAESLSGHGVYTRPTIYGVFVDEPATTGSFIGEYRGEVLDCETYRRDPINQYAALGLPKPHVRSVGPPINLIIDARGYGCDLRFVRSGCHPNVVLRPLIWRSSEEEAPKLKFGLFAAKDISKKEELVLGWEWDDQHVVHSLRSAIHAAMLADGSLASPVFSASKKTVYALSKKFDAVLTHIFGTFSSCACVVPGTCALAQMGQIVDARSMQGLDSEGKRKMRGDLGELVGAVRGWRRREVEVEGAKKWHKADMLDLRLTRSRTSEGDMETEPELEAQSDLPDESMDQQDDSMEIDEPAASPTPKEDDTVLPQESTSLIDVPPTATSVITLGSEIDSIPAPKSQTESDSPDKTTSLVERTGSSSSLSSAVSSIKPSLHDDDLESGSESDATTATIPKSQFSESESDEDDEDDGGEEEATEESAKRQPLGKVRKAKRVLSPVIEIESSSSFLHFDNHLSEDDDRELVVKKPKRQKVNKVPDSSPTSLSVNKSLPSTKAKKPSTVDAKKKALPVMRRGRQKRIVSSPVSDDESMDVDDDVSSRRRSSSSATKHVTSSPRSGKSIKLEQLEAATAITATDQEEPRAIVPEQNIAPLSTAIETTEAAVPDPEIVPTQLNSEQAVPAVLQTETEVESNAKETSPPPREPTPPPKEPTPPPPEPPKKVSLSEYLKNHKIRKESQTPLTTPATENPPKVVEFTAVEAPVVPTAGPTVSIADIPGFGNTQSVVAPATPSIITAAISPVKVEPETPAASTARLNLFEHLPSSRPAASSSAPAPTPAPAPATTTTLTTTPLATPTATTSYVPRPTNGEYFPLQPHSASFIPRVSSSFVPRTASMSSDGEVVKAQSPTVSIPSTSSYVPRAASVDESASPLKTSISDMPPPLVSRELPPHTPVHTTPGSQTSALPLISTPTSGTPMLSRAPPTGPKVPPTGPRGLGLAPGGPRVVSGEVAVPVPGAGGRGGFGTPRGGFGGRGVWRGRGGFRGGWRGS